MYADDVCHSEERLARLSCGSRRLIMHGLLSRNLLLLYRSTPTPPGPLRAVTAWDRGGSAPSGLCLLQPGPSACCNLVPLPAAAWSLCLLQPGPSLSERRAITFRRSRESFSVT